MNPYKRVHSPTEYDLLTTDQARKKYITEQFAEQMEAMSLNGSNGGGGGGNAPSLIFPDPPTQPNNNDPLSITSSFDNNIMKDWTRTNLVQTRVHGTMLPFEQRPGESKLRIPEFLLQASSSSSKPEARDFVGYNPLAWRTATASEEAEVNSTAPIASDIDNNYPYELQNESSAMEID
ncbi:hypothetical protein BDA99DRAFT_554453 [Phascolomyces articulosus]|uniref:Uncharacterized protein n=1 Tax=Phascolomyces articulosus TaxID=60185 RepID=A0AAD5KCX2_9FUNG|nr:hypothetical protein BDA99DRAFT_554453 [Phascolomyces articulosus]